MISAEDSSAVPAILPKIMPAGQAAPKETSGSIDSAGEMAKAHYKDRAQFDTPGKMNKMSTEADNDTRQAGNGFSFSYSMSMTFGVVGGVVTSAIFFAAHKAHRLVFSTGHIQLSDEIEGVQNGVPHV